MLTRKFKIGDKVTIDNDISMIVTDYVENHYNNDLAVVCNYFTKKGKLEISFFPQNALHLFAEKQQGNLKSYPLLYCKDLNCYGFKIYSSLIANNFSKEHFDESQKNLSEQETRFVYDLKKYGANTEIIKKYFLLLQAHFETQTVIAVPAHTTETNNLQKIYGTIITRIAEVAPRKYNHKHALSEDYAKSYKINFDKLKEKKVLLIDDVVTSGETLNYFAKELQNKGFEVIKFGLGLSHKLSFEKVSSFYLLES
jgi:Phosphoribosyl transferase domain